MKLAAPIFIRAMCLRLSAAGCTFAISLGLIKRAAEEEIELRTDLSTRGAGVAARAAHARALIAQARSPQSPGGRVITRRELRPIASEFAAIESGGQQIARLAALDNTAGS